MSHILSSTERETFLAETRVAVISIACAGRGPLSVPIWYRYAPGGEIGLWMDARSRKVSLLRREMRLTLVVQDTSRPYRYVSVEGPVTQMNPIDVDSELRPLVVRYLGEAAFDGYLAGFGGPEGVRGDVYVRVRPEHWRAEQL